ncbi:MAG: AsnC family transcriptional regulator [Gammaproteobacteria bacterium]|nr:MAG: AsnC family transcriptional regulator [Gammaproteobacteria bacterium]
MRAYFVQIKCEPGKAYEVANRLAELDGCSEVYSTAGAFDLLLKLYLDTDVDLGHYVNEQVHGVGNIRDTETLVTFRAFG